MLQEAYLFNPLGPDALLAPPLPSYIPAAFKTLRLILPRHLCSYHRIDCEGVPRLKLASFAKIQAQSLTPYSTHGACAVRQGHWLHLWTWDADLETQFRAKHADAPPVQTMPLSLYSQPLASGIRWQSEPGQPGIEAQLWHNHQLQSSLWLHTPPSPEDWAQLQAHHPELSHIGWPAVLPAITATPAQARPWARNLLQPHLAAGPRLDWQRLAPITLTLASALLAGWGSALWAEKIAYQQAIQHSKEEQAHLLAQLEPLQQKRQQAQQTLQWIESAQALAPAPTMHAILSELATILAHQALAVRELEINTPTLQATLVPTNGSAPRLTAILAALEEHPWFYDARFVDVVGGNGFKFSWRLRSTAGNTPLPQEQP